MRVTPWVVIDHTLSWVLSNILRRGDPAPLFHSQPPLDGRSMEQPRQIAPFVSNRLSISQQYFVTGWGGGLRPPAALVSAPAPALQSVSLSAKSDEEGYKRS
jgi:hypothetical protein